MKRFFFTISDLRLDLYFMPILNFTLSTSLKIPRKSLMFLANHSSLFEFSQAFFNFPTFLHLIFFFCNHHFGGFLTDNVTVFNFFNGRYRPEIITKWKSFVAVKQSMKMSKSQLLLG
jgi:hypothetical protein